jgi:CRP-like cAMP-binding protein
VTLGEVLYEAGAAPGKVYFPETALVSLIAAPERGTALEVGLVGSQGMVGVSLALGVRTSPVRAFVQGSGTALGMLAPEFSAELKRNRWLRREVSRWANTSMTTAMYLAACNSAHRLEQRLARWLLMTSDALSSATFYLTQDFLAQMLGVRRNAVSEVASRLQARGVIEYQRGNIEILDQRRLRAASCRCYRVIQNLTRI